MLRVDAVSPYLLARAHECSALFHLQLLVPLQRDMRVLSVLSALALLALPLVSAGGAVQQPEVVSERTQAVLRLDQEYSRILAANESASASAAATFSSASTSTPPKGMTTEYNAEVANQLFWLSATAYCSQLLRLARARVLEGHHSGKVSFIDMRFFIVFVGRLIPKRS